MVLEDVEMLDQIIEDDFDRFINCSPDLPRPALSAEAPMKAPLLTLSSPSARKTASTPKKAKKVPSEPPEVDRSSPVRRFDPAPTEPRTYDASPSVTLLPSSAAIRASAAPTFSRDPEASSPPTPAFSGASVDVLSLKRSPAIRGLDEMDASQDPTFTQILTTFDFSKAPPVSRDTRHPITTNQKADDDSEDEDDGRVRAPSDSSVMVSECRTGKTKDPMLMSPAQVPKNRNLRTQRAELLREHVDVDPVVNGAGVVDGKGAAATVRAV